MPKLDKQIAESVLETMAARGLAKSEWRGSIIAAVKKGIEDYAINLPLTEEP